ncbi:hypothetical protein NCLIV_049110 [Neospora caninum Liverpool]|uniref:Transmembrane protein n=1 Tax=Neospora caninum (strain Liverpool) TaxID=572307 RepID=F0VK81_NEOCL|nr:hypothetical protein NCLIV_049110 [Neospora caninum Liverpool]CBZ54482.1 hypothetical protein NCLIV_049110 [Neospora caninum Liverpool]CEL69195.1 TPA: hypothetical protein BN1204_049110 [Neospora caninum Liverpool]|eukprot:XP_003884512.1 hypothetical protein NCLIV_049110 [Neospora caninum Liverpool]
MPDHKRTEAHLSTCHPFLSCRRRVRLLGVLVIIVIAQGLYTTAFSSAADRDSEEHHGRVAQPQMRANPASSGDSPREQLPLPEGKGRTLATLVHNGISPGARLMIQGLRNLSEAQRKLAAFVHDAAKRCREGEEQMCETPGEPIGKRSGIDLPKLPVIRQFVLADDRNAGRSSISSMSDFVRTHASTVVATSIRTPRRQRWKPPGTRTSHPLQPRWGTNRLKGATETDTQEVFIELRAGGFFDMLNNMFLGGVGSADPANFEGGNQGSFFDFMYPLQTDYPWACVCDPNLYEKWEQKETPHVPCKNQVDMSAQGVTAYCNPLLHKINSAFRPGYGAFVFSFIVVSLSFVFSLFI